MTTTTDLSRLSPGDHVQDLFLVLEVETRTGDYPHTVLILGNCTGRISTGPFWAEQRPKIAGIEKRTIVQVVGEITTYHEKIQLRVDAIQILPPGMADGASFLPNVGSVEQHWVDLDSVRQNITAPRLRTVLDLLYADPEFRKRYERCPGSVAKHHARIGGLLVHTVQVAKIALSISDAVDADRDLVAAGALLHDIGKILAYDWSVGFEETELGALHGHVVLGALLLDRTVRSRDPVPCTDQELAILTHLILSHHGKPEHGAPVPPMTLEAEVVHYADNASAKCTAMAEAQRTESHFAGEGRVSSFGIWQLDRRRIYRGRSSWG